MFDNYMVKDGSFQNNGQDGFKFQVHVGDYRGCFLSLVRGYYIEVDGVEYPLEKQKFEINGKPPRTFDEIAKAVWEHWDYDDYATLYVECPGGLSKGPHRLGIMQGALVQYGWQPHDQEWIDNTPLPKDLISEHTKQKEMYYFDVEIK